MLLHGGRSAERTTTGHARYVIALIRLVHKLHAADDDVMHVACGVGVYTKC
jgi:hypothetical protein